MSELVIGAAALAGAAPVVWTVARFALRPFLRARSTAGRRRRPGKVAAGVRHAVRERSRLLAIRAEAEADYQAELAALHRTHTGRLAQIDAQLRAIDHGIAPQPLRDDAD